MFHHTRVLINLRAYENNLRQIASRLSTNCRYCAVLKADAYGHGIRFLAPIADACGADSIGVGESEEAETVRQLGIQRSIIRLRPAVDEEIEEAAAFGVEEIIGSLDRAISISNLGERLQRKIPVHIALDTGIGRMGFTHPLHKEQIQQVCALPGIRISGVMTHYPCADEEDSSITQEQWKRFQNETKKLAAVLPKETRFHTANSAAALRFPDAHAHFVRLGIATYGLSPSDVLDNEFLEPVMSVATKVVQVREMPKGATIGYGMTARLERATKIATLPIGYANGYLRDFSNKAHVLIHGVRRPVVGRVSMNMVTVDIGTVENVQTGDDVILLGTQGEESITANELAKISNTINYEMTCLLGNVNDNLRTTYP